MAELLIAQQCNSHPPLHLKSVTQFIRDLSEPQKRNSFERPTHNCGRLRNGVLGISYLFMTLILRKSISQGTYGTISNAKDVGGCVAANDKYAFKEIHTPIDLTMDTGDRKKHLFDQLLHLDHPNVLKFFFYGYRLTCDKSAVPTEVDCLAMELCEGKGQIRKFTALSSYKCFFSEITFHVA